MKKKTFDCRHFVWSSRHFVCSAFCLSTLCLTTQRYRAGILHNSIGPLNRNNQSFLEEVLPELLENVPLVVRRRMWFQQDGAPAHFYNGVRNFNFPIDRLVEMVLLLCHQYLPTWVHSIFLLGHTKPLVYSTPVQSEEDLVAKIAVASGDISEMTGLFHNIR